MSLFGKTKPNGENLVEREIERHEQIQTHHPNPETERRLGEVESLSRQHIAALERIHVRLHQVEVNQLPIRRAAPRRDPQLDPTRALPDANAARPRSA